MVKLDLFTHYNLQALNSLAVPAMAGNYVSVSSVEEVKQALSLAEELELSVLILGGGSNVVLPDLFVGLVIHINIKGIEVIAEDSEHVWIKVGAGENWHRLVEHCLNFHYWGLENLSLIPGTVGAAPMQNIGAYGVEFASVFEELNAIERSSRVEVTFSQDGCAFGYRDSIFKGRFKDQYIISSVTLKLNKQPHLQLSYPALNDALAKLNVQADEVTPTLIAETVCNIRRSKLPDPAHLPNAGSFFKNPVLPAQQVKKLKQNYPDLVSYPAGDGQEKIAAAWLIDQSGWKGREEFGVGVHREHALVVVNPGRKSGQHVLAVAEKIKADVRRQFSIDLCIEPDCYLSS